MKRAAVAQKLRRVDRALDRAIAANEIPGAVVCAAWRRDGDWHEHWWVRGNAVLQPERLPMRRDTLFDLASLTKPIATTTAILLLVDAGAIDLHAPVARYLPVFAERGKGGVLVRQLLNHSSGLAPWRPFYETLAERDRRRGERGLRDDSTLAKTPVLLRTAEGRGAVYDRIARSPLLHEPGEAAVYGDLGFAILGQLVEVMGERPLDVFWAERIGRPLGLTDARFAPAQGFAEPLRRRCAATENCPWRERIVWGEVHDANAWAMGGVAGHAGLFATAGDVLRFAQIVLEVWHGRSSALPAASLRTFLSTRGEPAGSGWAIGWDSPTPGRSSSGRYLSATAVGHLGFTGTSLWIDLERELAVVMLTNRVHTVAKRSPFGLRPIVHDAVIEALLPELVAARRGAKRGAGEGGEVGREDGRPEPRAAADAAPAPGAAAGEPRSAPPTPAAAASGGDSLPEVPLRPLPEPLESVHLIAIGGTGMGALAGLLRRRGYRVTGSDSGLYPPMDEALARWEIPVTQGFAPRHVLDADPDLVIVGNAVRPDNPEVRAAVEAGACCRSFPHALYELAIAARHPVVVAGTHGKTTSTALVATLLLETGADPSLLAGGLCANFDGPFREGGGAHFVVEGDEYDSAFFDKRPKFTHYRPQTLLLTSLEFDHADIYRDLAHLERAFADLVAGLPPGGHLVAADREALDALCRAAPCPVARYGTGAGAGWRAVGLAPGEAGTAFEIHRDGRRVLRAELPLYGVHNVENALGALVTAHHLGVPLEAAAGALGRFRGVRRRQELRGRPRGIAIIDDFAHHPTAVRCTLAALRIRFPGRRLIAAFEPRSNTSRRALFQDDYVAALAGADWALIATVPPSTLYSATGPVGELFDAERAALALRGRGVDALAPGGAQEIAAAISARARPGDVIAVMSNGNFGGLCEELLARLGEPPRAAGETR